MMNSNNSKSFMKEEDQLNSTLYVDNLLSAGNDWKNIQDIIKSTLKALTDVVRNQGNVIKELERQLNNKANKVDLINGLGAKANVSDVMRTFNEVATSIETRPTLDEVQLLMEDKVTKSDVQYIINIKPSIEEVKSLISQKIDSLNYKDEIESEFKVKLDEQNINFNKKLQQYAQNKEIPLIYQALETKANINEVNELLSTKASKESLATGLQRKINKSEIDMILGSKVDVQDFQLLLTNLKSKADVKDLEKIDLTLNTKADRSELIQMTQLINSKAEYKDCDSLQESIINLRSEFTKKLNDFDIDIDKLIESIKIEFDNLKNITAQIDRNKVENKEIENLHNILVKKADQENLILLSTQMKNDMKDTLQLLKEEVLNNKTLIDRTVQDKDIQNDFRLNKLKEDFDNKLNCVNNDIESILNQIPEITLKVKNLMNIQGKEFINDYNKLRDEIIKFSQDIEDLFNTKADKKDFDYLQNKVFNDLDSKVSLSHLDNLYKTLTRELNDKSEDSRQVLNKTLKLFENDVYKIIDKKANQFDIQNALVAKADLGSTNLAIQNKASIAEVEKIKTCLDKVCKEIGNKIDFGKFENFMKETKKILEDLQKDVLGRSTIKETISMIKNKADIDDINKALVQIHEELDVKANLDQFKISMDNQAMINDALCSETCVGRWVWKSGQVKNGYAVPWDVQLVNTAPDNFLWEKEKTNIVIASAGLYEINLGFYADKKPTVQLLVNGEPVLSAVNSASYVVHHSSGRLKNVGKHSSGNITGLTLIDFICLPERSRVSVSFTGEDGSEGFLSLKKL